MKKIIVAKFGGSSLANAKCFQNAKKLIKKNKCNAIVISAMGIDSENKQKITDALIKLHNSNYQDLELLDNIIERHRLLAMALIKDENLLKKIKMCLKKTKNEILNKKDYDFTLSRGEFLCAMIMSHYLSLPFIDAKNAIKFDGRVVSSRRTKLNLRKIAFPYVIGGFYGSDQNNNIVTFSRGGSDCTASLVAEAMNAKILIKFTDQNGILKNFNTKNQKTIKKLSFAELLFMCKQNKNLMHPDSIPNLMQNEIVLKIKNSFNKNAKFTTCK